MKDVKEVKTKKNHWAVPSMQFRPGPKVRIGADLQFPIRNHWTSQGVKVGES